MSKTMSRPAAQAGAFYTGDAEALRQEVERYIEEAAPVAVSAPPVGFVSPHAGYRFSGATAGHVYRQLRDLAPETVFVLAPSHRASFPLASMWDGPAYSTPLGDYPIDMDIVEQIRQALPGIECQRHAEAREHSLEVQIPFLQVACPEAKFVPLLIGAQDRANTEALVEGLARAVEGMEWAERGRLALVASSDGYHGYSHEECLDSDALLAEAVRSMDVDALYGSAPSGHALACGRGPIVAVLQLSKRLGASEAQVLDRSTSADTIPHREGDWIVGYLAAMFA